MTPARPLIRESDYDRDLPAIRSRFEDYAAGIGVDLTFQGFAEELAALPGDYARPRGAIFVADVDAALVGVIAFRPMTEYDCEIKRLYVQPAFRGMGLATALASCALDAARAAGYRPAYLDALRTMKPAIAVYERLGFRETAPYYDNPLPDVLYLRKALAA